MILHRTTKDTLPAITAYMTAEEWRNTHQDFKSEPGATFRSVMTMCPFKHRTSLFPVKIIPGKPRHLECACCGGDAGRFYQWHNQDTGYGACPGCVDSTMARGPEYLARHEIDFIDLYGIPGVHRAPATHEKEDTRHA
jgi:hypothetical protein